MCVGSSFDAHYSWTNEYSNLSEKYVFRGFTGSVLKYEQEYTEWRLSLFDNPFIYATYNGSEPYPFGTFNWYIFNDTCKKVEPSLIISKNVNKMPLNFNGCNTNNEFNCADGTW